MPHHLRGACHPLRAAPLPAAALVLLAACETPLAPAGAFGCTHSEDCGPGMACVAGVCVTPEELGDISLPDGYGAPEVVVRVEVVEKVVEKVACPAGACDDGQPCTDDTCQDGQCRHTPREGGPCDDGSACTGTKASPDACKGGTCTGAAVDCDDGEPCTLDGCAPKTGCTHAQLPLACDDGNACTTSDLCVGGACKGGKAPGCDDGEPCTDDGCDPKTGCTHGPNTALCDDGDACTGSAASPDRCEQGVCAGGAALPCECTANADCAASDDGNPCTGLVVCGAPGLPGRCTVDAATVPHCDPSGDTACRVNTCTAAAGGCVLVAVADGRACDDGDACTGGTASPDACKGGACTGPAVDCDDGEPCTLDLCDPAKGCTHGGGPLAGKPCDDGSACSSGDTCQGGKCAAGKARDCDDGRPCTADSCEPKTGKCAHKALGYAGCCKALGGKPGGACVATDSAGRKWGLVPAGTFFMGCNAALDKSCASNEKPQHQVEISKPFWLGLYEVTVSEYKACVDAGKCSAPSVSSSYSSNWGKSDREQHPMNFVSWSRSQVYCQWAGGTLPTEAQWELAARGRCEENGGASGCASKMRVYPWGSTSPVCGTHAVFRTGGAGCGKDRTWAAGTGSAPGAGPYGHLDLAGNVYEWVSDRYSSNYYQTSPKQDPENTNSGSGGVFRGGSFVNVATNVRAGLRAGDLLSVALNHLGLRCARPFQPCDDGDPCTVDARAKDGTCVDAPAEDGTSCDDGSPCTAGDTCKSGQCAAGKAVSCDDGNACTVDLCSKVLGCVHRPVEDHTACDDGSKCTSAEACSKGSCVAGKMTDCDDGKPCTADSCEPKTSQCVHKALDYAACCKALGSKPGGACVKTDSAGRKWGLVPAGTFRMGCNAKLDKSCRADEKPQHEVTTTKPFWLGLYEVTVAQYEACVDAGKCTAPSTAVKTCSGAWAEYNNWGQSGRLDYPVNCVNWKQSAAYCTWIGGRLATEAEWELAARGRCEENGGASGCAEKMRVYPWGNGTPACGQQAVLASGGRGCGQERTWAAGTGSASGRGPYGHYDLSGNVWEWVRDRYSSSYYQVSPEQDPVNTGSASTHVYRGGGFGLGATFLRAGIRAYGHPSYAYAGLGLRCARPFAPCDDGEPCTTDAPAKDGTCVHAPAKDGTACDDGDPCTTANTCKSGKCAAGKAVSCDDGNACTVDLCSKALGCVHKAVEDGMACEDGSK